jgi:hypothetical protein
MYHKPHQPDASPELKTTDRTKTLPDDTYLPKAELLFDWSRLPNPGRRRRVVRTGPATRARTGRLRRHPAGLMIEGGNEVQELP